MEDSEPAKKKGLLTLPRRCAVGLVRFYQCFLSPLKKMVLGAYAGCRFHPTCSEYARQAFLEHGLLYGGFLFIRRLLRCHPFHPGGCDPIPAKRGKTAVQAPEGASELKQKSFERVIGL